jgi:hypothetical protein
MFDIKDKHSTKEKKYKKKVYTPQQIKEMLVGYMQVPRDKWIDIPIESHVRYFKKDNTFVRGGFVINHWVNKDGKHFVHLANGFNKGTAGYATWPVAYESTDKIFKKLEPKNGIEMDLVRNKTAEIITQINRLVDVVKEQRRVIDQHEKDIKTLQKALRNN